MSPDRDIRSDLEPDATDEIVALAERLERERPVPTAAFRGALRRQLLAGGATRTRPTRLRLLITAYAGAGSVLLAVGAMSAGGIGPLAS